MSMLGGLANAIGLGSNAAQQAQGLMNVQPGAYQQIMGGGTTATQQMLMQQYQAAQQASVEEFDPNKHEAWTMSMSTLVNLWRAKYLDEWLIFNTNVLDAFWREAYVRLKMAHKFEEAPGQWHRLKEDA